MRAESTSEAAVMPRPPLWRRLVSFHLGSGLVLGVAGFYLGWFAGHQITAPSLTYFAEIDQNDLSIFLGYLVGVLGFLTGLGFANYPLARMLGHPPSLPKERKDSGMGRYLGLSTEHKVVGIQYLWGIGLFFFIGGLNAIMIRVELLRPNNQVFPAGQYLTVVGLHGTMMLGIMSSAILGPFGGYFVPILIGARRMAFPRLSALSFWLLMVAGAILTTAIFFGGFPTGWTGYAPLLDESNGGIDAYIVFFALVGISMCLLGVNLVATVASMRAPGLTWWRLPIFVWGLLTTAMLMVLASPILIAVLGMGALDRTAQTAFFIPSRGGSEYLYENLFWIFGHPEVYVLALPGFGIVLELLPVFARKPLWGYRLAVGGMVGVTFLSFLVWQHHLFVSGINSDSRPFFMFDTELISVPTGLTFLCGLMTLWRGRIRLTVPMLFCLAWFFNFLIGGLSGVFLADAPSDVTTHGSFFVVAHFHYTIVGGLVFAFFAAIYFWVPKMTGWRLNDRLSKIHFWSMFIAFNSTFAPMFVTGFLGQARRSVTYASNLQFLNDWSSISAFVLGLSLLLFLANLVYSLAIARVPAETNPWGSRSIEWQLPSPVPPRNFDVIPVFTGDPYGYGSDGVHVALPAAAPAGESLA